MEKYSLALIKMQHCSKKKFASEKISKYFFLIESKLKNRFQICPYFLSIFFFAYAKDDNIFVLFLIFEMFS